MTKVISGLSYLGEHLDYFGTPYSVRFVPRKGSMDAAVIIHPDPKFKRETPEVMMDLARIVRRNFRVDGNIEFDRTDVS